MAYLYVLEINYKRVNSEKRGFKFTISGDIDKSFGCEVNSVSTTGHLDWSTMRVARLIVEKDKFEFATKLHCTFSRIIFRTNSPLPTGSDMIDAGADTPLPGQLVVVSSIDDISGYGYKPEDWWWRLSPLDENKNVLASIAESYVQSQASQIFVLVGSK